jgi:hypothetical protein
MRVIGWLVGCGDEVTMEELRKQLTQQWECLDGVIANVGDGRSVPDTELPDVEQLSKIWISNFETALNDEVDSKSRTVFLMS